MHQWTGEQAVRLQAALRMSNDGMARRLDIATRTVAAWHANPSVVPRPTTQASLDTLLAGVDPQTRDRFVGTGHEQDPDETGRLLLASTRDSLRLLAAEESVTLADLDAATRTLAVDYLGARTPETMLRRAFELRSEALGLLRAHDHSPSELADLWVVIGRLQGVLAYAAVDLGDSATAAIHARAGHVAAARAGDDTLAGWLRGTQALVARFDGNFEASAAFVLDGLRKGGSGTTKVRLLSGLAQSRAGVGDAVGTWSELDCAADARDHATADQVGGLFAFSEAKQSYYVASSLIWLDDARSAHRAVHHARGAVQLWNTGSKTDRALVDESLVRIYEATAHVKLGALDAARAALLPVLGVPPERRVSWIVRRLTRVADELGRPRFHNSRVASSLAAELRNG